MAGILKITISQSTKDLKQLLHQQSSARLKERLQALYWLKSGKVKTRQDLAQLLARGESTVYRWLNLYRQGGLPGLLEVKTSSGRAPKIQGQALERLKQRLAEPEGFNSYGAVQQWLADACEVEAAYKTVRYKLNSKLKVPRPRSHKADEPAQQRYKKNSLR